MSDRQNKIGFGRSAEDFIRSLDKSSADEGKLSEYSGMYIKSLASSDGGKAKVRVLIENRSGSEEIEFILLGEFVEELSLEIGEISEDIILDIERYAEVTKAYNSAVASLAFADSSCKALARKLVQKGFDRESAEDAVGVVLSRGLIDEDRIVESRVRVFLGKRWGRGRILAKLREESFCDSTIKHAVEALAEVDFITPCSELLQKKYPILPTDRQEREKIYAAMSRYGYSSSEIREAIQMIADEQQYNIEKRRLE